MATAKKQKQSSLLTLIVVAIILVLCNNLLISPTMEKNRIGEETLKARERELQNMIKQINDLPKRLVIVEGQYNAEKEKLEAIEKKFPHIDRELIDDVSDMATRTGITIASTRNMPETIERNMIIENMQLVAKGDFSSLLNFISGFEEMGRLCGISDLRFSGIEPTTLNCKLTAFSQKKGN